LLRTIDSKHGLVVCYHRTLSGNS